MQAFVLLRAVGDHRVLMKTLTHEKRISRVYNITGDNDILIEINSKNIEELKDVLNRVRSTKGVISTASYIVLVKYK
jgi:DNA-binding Lrp family transcriptional regulator